MALVQRTINQCDVCGYEWIPRSNGERCGNRECRSTKWNASNAKGSVPSRLVGARAVGEDQPPNIATLREICSGTMKPSVETIETPPLQVCPKTGFNEQDGEKYGCRLAKGHKGNCLPGERIDA